MGVMDKVKNKFQEWNKKKKVQEIVFNSISGPLKRVMVDYYVKTVIATHIYYYYPASEDISIKIINIKKSDKYEGMYLARVNVEFPIYIENRIILKDHNPDKLILGTDLTIKYIVVLAVNVNTNKAKILRYENMGYSTEGRTYIKLIDVNNKITWERTWGDWYDIGYDDGYASGLGAC
ncbi:hypothetical protein [Thermococcus nautili]|uniref:Uncharacterized protein n=1 Tax=Thermococcus nautili TaxID=195522 RepID=W8PL78_9EURY|nr:hypothetical protein [Thermococcus nautili]AHL22794.1 hypothetical protein BD01_1177 [Thermococcus nautili]CAI1492868.1 conserved protein of unknown function [Thermococcus nautili]